MYKKVYYIVKSVLHYYPPCVSQIRILNDLGVSVSVVYGSCDERTVSILQSQGIECIELSDPRGKYPGKIDKVNNWLNFRKHFCQYIQTINKKETLFWVGNAETLLSLKGLINKYDYAVTFLELLDQMPRKRTLIKPLAQKARFVVTCEETRSYLMKYWFDLKTLPYTMPNKPYNLDVPLHSRCTTDGGRYVMNALQNKKFVIYQGIFQDEEYIITFAKVLKDCFPEYGFVMMGIDRKINVENVIKANRNTIVIDYIPAPLHLEVTSNASIGMLFYVPKDLNRAFCAPNKIFEYSKYGLPIIGNDVPGLKNTIGKADAGICTDFSYESIRNALEQIINHYDYYSKKSLQFYNSVDNVKTVKTIIDDTGILGDMEE